MFSCQKQYLTREIVWLPFGNFRQPSLAVRYFAPYCYLGAILHKKLFVYFNIFTFYE
jgi:hypothetical protein